MQIQCQEDHKEDARKAEKERCPTELQRERFVFEFAAVQKRRCPPVAKKRRFSLLRGVPVSPKSRGRRQRRC